MNNELRIIISGGGTGGHIFPAVSIANAIKAKHPEAKILFVGALGRMEMQRVPDAGYEIKGLPICGFDRKHLLKNISVLFKIWKSQRMAKKIIKDFQPMATVGVGGYASGPTLNVCASKGIPCLIQEQNSYAGEYGFLRTAFIFTSFPVFFSTSSAIQSTHLFKIRHLEHSPLKIKVKVPSSDNDSNPTSPPSP